jgi:hypothetical protein
MKCSRCSRPIPPGAIVSSRAGTKESICQFCARDLPLGWICPRCHAVNAPGLPSCGCGVGLRFREEAHK